MSQHDVVWSEYAFEGKLVNVRLDTVKLPNGDHREREIVEHNGAVAIVPVLSSGRIVLVRQYRPAVQRSLLELPAGTVEPDEDVSITASRELQEETGYTAGSIQELVRFFVSPGWCNEEVVLYVANDLTDGERALEDDEDIEIETYSPEEISGLIRSGDIGDAKTMVGLSLYLGLQLPLTDHR